MILYFKDIAGVAFYFFHITFSCISNNDDDDGWLSMKKGQMV